MPGRELAENRPCPTLLTASELHVAARCQFEQRKGQNKALGEMKTFALSTRLRSEHLISLHLPCGLTEAWSLPGCIVAGSWRKTTAGSATFSRAAAPG